MRNQLIFKLWQFPHLSETFITSQIITAINCGFEVKILVKEVLSFKESKQIELLEKYNIEEKIILEDYAIPKNKILRLGIAFWLLIKNIKSLAKIIKFYKYQNTFSLSWLYQFVFYKQFKHVSVIHIQYGTNKSPLDVLKKIKALKASLIVSFHGHDAFFPINGFIPNNGYYTHLFSVTNAIVANTPYLAKKLEGLGCPPEILKIIPVGVDTSFFYPKQKKPILSKTFKLMMVGRLDPVKGHIFAFKAMTILKNKGYDIKLTLVGEGAERPNLERYITEHHLENHIQLLGAKSQEDIRSLLWEHQLFIFPSVSLPDGRRETQGLAPIEAQACGVPVVAFNSGGVKYTVKNGVTGFLCEEENTIELSDKIEKLILEPELLLKMEEQAITFIETNFSKEIIDKRWETLYKNKNFED